MKKNFTVQMVWDLEVNKFINVMAETEEEAIDFANRNAQLFDISNTEQALTPYKETPNIVWNNFNGVVSRFLPEWTHCFINVNNVKEQYESTHPVKFYNLQWGDPVKGVEYLSGEYYPTLPKELILDFPDKTKEEIENLIKEEGTNILTSKVGHILDNFDYIIE